MKISDKKPFSTLSSGVAALLSLALASGASQTLADDQVLFQLNGSDYQASDLSPGSQLALYTADFKRYQSLQEILDNELFEIYLAEEAKRLGKTSDEIRAERLAGTEPDEKTVRAFYESRKDRIKKPYDAVRDRYAGYLHGKRVEERKAEWVAAYREKNDFKAFLTRPVSPVVGIATEGFPVQGNPKAKVTIVEFADFRCGYCQKAADALGRVMKRFEGKVKLVYMDFPILSNASRLVAQGGVCADRQGKFRAYHDLAYRNQSSLTKKSPVQFAGEIGLDKAAFRACLESEETVAKVERSEKEARRLGLRGTPSLFVNGRRLISRDLEHDLIRAVEAALAE